jgi:hypothetical protein
MSARKEKLRERALVMNDEIIRAGGLVTAS